VSIDLSRRTIVAFVGGTALAWPLSALAQHSAIPVIGFLNGQSPATSAHLVAAFRKGLNETGYVEGRNVVVEYRWAEGQTERLSGLAADLVRRSVAVISTGGSPTASLAAKAATSTIPIVFAFGGDPVESGLVASLSHPGGNVTGVSQLSNVLEGKRFGLLHELIPTARLIAVLLKANSPYAESPISAIWSSLAGI
jgi:putative ABC transport system substrate-binding protein